MKKNILTAPIVAIASKNNAVTSGAAILAGGMLFSGSANGAVVFEENFESLAASLQPFVSPTEGGGDGTDWTDVLPSGWVRDNSTTPGGGPVEFFGWNAFDKNSWVATAGNQSRDLFTRGLGVVMVADADEYDDAGGIEPNLFNVFLQTPNISLTGFVADSIEFSFDSSFRPYDTMTALVDVSFDNGSSWTNLLSMNSGNVPGGDSSLVRVDERITLNGFNASAFDEVMFRFGNTNAGNDWWWAVDNVQLTGTAVPEPTAGLFGLGLLGLAAVRRRLRKS